MLVTIAVHSVEVVLVGLHRFHDDRHLVNVYKPYHFIIAAYQVVEDRVRVWGSFALFKLLRPCLTSLRPVSVSPRLGQVLGFRVYRGLGAPDWRNLGLRAGFRVFKWCAGEE